MRATLSFKLPEEQEEFDMAMQAASLNAALDKLDNSLRSVTKHEDPWLKELIQKELDDGTQCPATAAALTFRRLISECRYPSID